MQPLFRNRTKRAIVRPCYRSSLHKQIMCQYALYSYQCGHHNLLCIEECENHKQNAQISSQLNETLPPTPITTAEITYHYLDEGLPIATAVTAAEPDEKDLVSCKCVSCHAGFTFDLAIQVVARIRVAIQLTYTSYNDLHEMWLARHFALQKFRVLATPRYLAGKPKLKERLEEHKEWARALVKVEKRLARAERVLYESLGDVEWLKTRVKMPMEWKKVIRDVHYARSELGMVRFEVEGEECR